MQKIYLHNIKDHPGIDNTFNNVLWFESKQNQQAFFNKRIVGQVESNIYVTGNRSTLTIDKSYEEFERLGVDYVTAFNPDDKLIYYFVVDYEYKTSNATTLFLEVDPIQTYLFDIEFLPSHVDRCHVNRYKEEAGITVPAGGTVFEGLDMGDMILTNVTEHQYRDKYIIASTTPLGKNKWLRPNNGGGGVSLDGPSDRQLLAFWETVATRV